MAEERASPVALVLGATGQLGRELQLAIERGLASGLAQQWHFIDRQRVDLSDPAQIRQLLDDVRPGLIVNASAYTAVDRAESEAELARRVNADAVTELARYAGESGAALVHFSTDYVFDGELDRPYRETDPPHPQSVYGHTKWQGEQAVQGLAPRHLLIRTSWVFGRHGGNFLKTMLRLAQERDELKVVADQWGAPTSARLLATQSLRACQMAMQAESRDLAPAWGLYHLTCAGHTHWQAYAQHVLSRAADWGVALRVRAERVQAIGTADYPTPARRPLNSRLDCSRWEQVWRLPRPAWSDEVDAVLADVLVDQGVLTPAMRAMITSVRSAQ